MQRNLGLMVVESAAVANFERYCSGSKASGGHLRWHLVGLLSCDYVNMQDDPLLISLNELIVIFILFCPCVSAFGTSLSRCMRVCAGVCVCITACAWCMC